MIFDIVESIEFNIKFITAEYLSSIKKYLDPDIFSFCLTDNDFNKLIMHICYLNNIKLLKFLLPFRTNKKIKLNVISLNYACENNNLQMVKLLLSYNKFIITNDSPLIKACKNSNLKLLKLLLQNYIPINKNLYKFSTDIHIIKFLLELKE